MRSRLIYKKIQGLIGGLLLMSGIIFMFMTFSLSAALADPIQQVAVQSSVESPRSVRSTSSDRNVRGSATDTKAIRARTTTTARSNNVVSRSVAVRPSSATSRTTSAAHNTSRSVRSRSNAVRVGQSRNLVARTGVASTNSVSAARVGLTGSAIRASTSSAASTLSSKLALQTYSNLIDSSTGMIAASAYSDCVQSYYTCMDEICTARNPGQRRCACAGRVKTFNQVEATLQTAKEDLLKVSGELSLMIATKGESIHSAFELTDAEKSLNCVSFRDEKKSIGTSGSMKDWCDAHMMLDTAACESSMNSTCNSLYGNGSGDSWMSILNGADSDILSSLQTYADTLDEVNTFDYSDDDNLFTSFNNVDLVVNGSSSVFDTETTADTLAQTWGYDLFEYAHNNVCGRVLDSCFNGIYEMCGNRPAEQGGGTGPYNLNSDITVNGNDIEFVTPKGSGTSTGTAACYGYTSSSGDPYSTIRQPVADARLSVLQKYVLDANADCDVYGEELKTQAQNMAYQKIAATQLLQKKRLEFATNKETSATEALSTAKEMFKSCVTEIYDCYDQQATTNKTWTVARIKNYCAQSSEIPSCYEDMVCDRDAKILVSVVDNETNCANSQDAASNTCRNMTSLSEILNGTGATATTSPSASTGNSKAFREYCLQHTPGIYGEGSVRDFGVTWGPGI
jgi:hypothetical protein